MTALAPLLFAGVLGFLALACLLPNTALHRRWTLIVLMTAPVGLALCSLIVFIAYAVGGAKGPWLSLLTAYALSAILLLRWLRCGEFPALPSLSRQAGLKACQTLAASLKEPRTLLAALIFLASLGLALWGLSVLCHIFLSGAVWNAYGGWDPKFIWHVKAKFFFRDPAQWAGMFSPLISWTHPDYPLLIPGSIAWGWNWFGKEWLLWPALVNLVYGLAGPAMVFWHFHDEKATATGMAAAGYVMLMSVYAFWFYEQYVDIPLAFWIGGATILLMKSLRDREPRLLVLTGFFAGMTAWTKLEGVFFNGWMFLTVLAVWILPRHTSGSSTKKTACLAYLGGVALPILIFMIMKIGFAPHGEYWGSGRQLGDYLTDLLRDPVKTKTILIAYYHYSFGPSHWNYLWQFFLMAGAVRLVCCRFKDWPSYGWIAALIPVLMQAGYFIIFHISPYEVHMQIETAMARLLLQSCPPAVIFIFETFRIPDLIKQNASSN